MAAAMAYIVTEWCLQSHLATLKQTSSAAGLRRTRRFRWLTSPFRDAVHYSIEACYAVRRGLSSPAKRRAKAAAAVVAASGNVAAARQARRSVRWTSRIVAVSRRRVGSRVPSPVASRGADVEMQPIAGGSDVSLLRPSRESRRDSSASPSRSAAGTEGGRSSFGGGEASSSRVPRASGESRAGSRSGSGSGGLVTLHVPAGAFRG